MADYINHINQYEDELAQRFRQVLLSLEQIGSHQDGPRLEIIRENEIRKRAQTRLAHILLEKRLLSRAFVPLYQTAAARIQDTHLRQVVEGIIADEYHPDDHQKLLDQDLKKMGIYVPDEAYVPYQETVSLVQNVQTTIEQATDDIECGFFLRTYGELLPGIECDVLWPRLAKDFKLTPETSVFYWHHKVHDQKRVELGQSGETHTDKFNNTLARLIQSPVDTLSAKRAMKKAYDLRSRFWEQFFGA